MAGVVKVDGLQVSQGSSGTPVSISEPIGSQPSADSLSVTLASDQTPIDVNVIGGSPVTNDGTFAKETGGNLADILTELVSILAKLNTSIAVTGPLTDTELRATPVPISAASLPLPTGGATAANQTNGQQAAYIWDPNTGQHASVNAFGSLEISANGGKKYAFTPAGGGTDTISSNGYTHTWAGIWGSRLFVLVNGTYAGITLQFNGSRDGTILFPLLARRMDTGGVGHAHLPDPNASILFEVEFPGEVQGGLGGYFNIQSSTYGSGSLNYYIIYDDGVANVSDIANIVLDLEQVIDGLNNVESAVNGVVANTALTADTVGNFGSADASKAIAIQGDIDLNANPVKVYGTVVVGQSDLSELRAAVTILQDGDLLSEANLLPVTNNALVNDNPPNYEPGDTQPLSLTTEGRLRVSSVSANTELEFFRDKNFFFDVPYLTSEESYLSLKSLPLDI